MSAPYKVVCDLEDSQPVNVMELLHRREVLRRDLRLQGKIKYDNDVGNYFQLQGKFFSCLIVPPYGFQKNTMLYFWNEDGTKALGEWGFKGDILPQDVREEIKDILSHAVAGEMRCSDCGTWIPIPTTYKNSYFAGVYCDTCWNTKGWKEKESKETYE